MGQRGYYVAAATDPATLAAALEVTLGDVTDGEWDESWIAQRADECWSVFFTMDEELSDRYDFTFDDDNPCGALAERVDVIYCMPDESISNSIAAQWSGGKLVWSIFHDGMTGENDHLDVSGTPPPPFAEIRDRRLAQQRQSDAAGERVDHVFDVPVELVEHLIGFRHDIVPQAGTFSTYYAVEP